MKSLLAGLLVIAALGGPVYAASTETVTIVVDTPATGANDLYGINFRSNNDIPDEEKVVEIHMTRNEVTAAETKKNRRNIQILPFAGGTCSGSFINNHGDVLTARHCVSGFDDFEIQTNDRRRYAGVVIATSALHDLALIHIDLANTPYFELADNVYRGEKVYIIGSPLGITDTLSTGVVAKLDGDVTLLDCGALPGNSGSAVFNSKGKLIGVLNAGFVVMFGVTHLNQAQGLDAVRFFLADVEKSNGRR